MTNKQFLSRKDHEPKSKPEVELILLKQKEIQAKRYVTIFYVHVLDSIDVTEMSISIISSLCIVTDSGII